MKKNTIIALTLSMLISFFPINIFANDVNVGLEIEGEMVISAITTISANIKLDVNTRESTTSYLRARNTGNVDLDFSIIDIAPSGVDIPNIFVDYSTIQPVIGKEWLQLNEEETKQYISFAVSKDEWNFQTIMPDTAIKLGRIFSYQDIGYDNPNEYREDEFRQNATPSRSFALRAKTGYIWGATTNVTYTVTTLVSPSVEVDIINPSKHEKIGDVNFFAIVNSLTNEDPVLVAEFVTETDLPFLTIDDLNFSGKITSPNGDVHHFNGFPINPEISLWQPDFIYYNVDFTVNGFTFSEPGTYYININFGLLENDIFVPENNYSQVLSITINP
jgi:hypothetical protein